MKTHYVVALEDPSPADGPWIRSRAEQSGEVGKDTYVIELADGAGPEQHIKELAIGGCTAEFRAISREEFHRRIGFVS